MYLSDNHGINSRDDYTMEGYPSWVRHYLDWIQMSKMCLLCLWQPHSGSGRQRNKIIESGGGRQIQNHWYIGKIRFFDVLKLY